MPHRFAISVKLKQDHILLGEPIVLTYTITQPNGPSVLPKLGIWLEQKAPWLSVQLQDDQGKVVASTELWSIQGKQTLTWSRQGLRQMLLPPGRPYVDSIIFGDKRLLIPDKGAYRVIVRAWSLRPISLEKKYRPDDFPRSNYLSVPEVTPPRMNPPPPVEPDETIFSLEKEFTLPLTVERNTNLITERAEELSSQIQHSYARLQIKPLVEELFSLCGAAAHRVQRALFDDIAENRNKISVVSDELAMLVTPEALDFLADQCWDRKRRGIIDSLSKMRYHGDLDLRRQIEALFNLHHEKIPSAIIDH